MQTDANKTDREILYPWQRWAELMTVFVMLLLLGFLGYHQVANTGFFTDKFRSLEMVCLYGPIIFSFIAPIVRAWTGRRNPARPFEIATNVFLALGSLWLLTIFPFNFAHLADTLPGPLHFILAWTTDGIGKVFLIFQIIVVSLAALATTWQYLSIRRREFVAHTSPHIS